MHRSHAKGRNSCNGWLVYMFFLLLLGQSSLCLYQSVESPFLWREQKLKHSLHGWMQWGSGSHIKCTQRFFTSKGIAFYLLSLSISKYSIILIRVPRYYLSKTNVSGMGDYFLNDCNNVQYFLPSMKSETTSPKSIWLPVSEVHC